MSIPSDVLAAPGRLFSEWIKPRLQSRIAGAPELAAVAVAIEVNLRLDSGRAETWQVRLVGGLVEIEAGPCPRPDVIVKAHLADWGDLLQGFLTPAAALVDGRLQISGDVALASRLLPLLLG